MPNLKFQIISYNKKRSCPIPNFKSSAATRKTHAQPQISNHQLQQEKIMPNPKFQIICCTKKNSPPTSKFKQSAANSNHTLP